MRPCPNPATANIFLVIYGILFSVGVGLIVYRGPGGDAVGWVDQVIWIWGATAPLAAVAVPGAVVLTEIARWVMVLAAWLENRLERSREEYRARIGEEARVAGLAAGRVAGLAEGRVAGLAEGRAEARAETDREWEGWLTRREAAAARGEPFAEPPPSVSRNGSG